MVTSIFVLGKSSTSRAVLLGTLTISSTAFAIGPLVLAPASELYGRVRVLQYANVFYIIFNLVCAFAKTKGQVSSISLFEICSHVYLTPLDA